MCQNDMTIDPPVRLEAHRRSNHWLLTIDIRCGLLAPSDLKRVEIPKAIELDLGVVISGRGPIWLYAHLVELLRDVPWLATFDVGKNCPIVVQSHGGNSPSVGRLIDPVSAVRRRGDVLQGGRCATNIQQGVDRRTQGVHVHRLLGHTVVPYFCEFAPA